MYSFPTCEKKNKKQSSLYALFSPPLKGHDAIASNDSAGTAAKPGMANIKSRRLWTRRAHAYLTEAQWLDLLGNSTLFQVFVYFSELVVLVDEPLDVRDEVTHQVLHSRTRPVVLRLGFSGDTLGEFLHATDLQKQLTVSLTEGQLLLMQLAFKKYPVFIILLALYKKLHTTPLKQYLLCQWTTFWVWFKSVGCFLLSWGQVE